MKSHIAVTFVLAILIAAVTCNEETERRGTTVFAKCYTYIVLVIVIVLSVLLFCYILVRSFSFSRLEAPSLKFAVAVNPPTSVPAVLNGFGFWTVLTVCLICLSYGYPIAEFFMLPNHNVPVNSLTREMVK